MSCRVRYIHIESINLQAPGPKLLKKDVFGSTYLIASDAGSRVRRDAAGARFPFRWLARSLLSREARALSALAGTEGVPSLLRVERTSLERAFLEGMPMHVAKPASPEYFVGAARLLRRLHRHGVAHNDLAKEPNLLVTPDGRPAIIDFQLASTSPRRGRIFRMLAREDTRHLLKHKRTYCPAALTRRERDILANPAAASRLFMATVKPVYLFVTRRIMGWQDREGAGDRQ